MVGQIEKTQEVQIQVSKVVLVGGFGDSPTLKWYIRKTLDEYNNKHGTNIQLSVAPQNEGVIGVAAGSAIRLCDRSNGPARTPRMSIGIQRSIAQEDQTDPDVQSQTAVANEFNRVKYIRNTLEWVVKKVINYHLERSPSQLINLRVKASSSQFTQPHSTPSMSSAREATPGKPKRHSIILGSARKTTFTLDMRRTRVSLLLWYCLWRSITDIISR
jgi:hypothetical protein